MSEILKESVRGWSGYVLSMGDIRLGIAPEIGGRIISLVYKGEELLFVQEEHAGETFSFDEVVRCLFSY